MSGSSKAAKTATALVLGFTVANFGYQYFTDANFPLAAERSFFQAIAILVAVGVSKFTSN
jgi:hypothetical protein